MLESEAQLIEGDYFGSYDEEWDEKYDDHEEVESCEDCGECLIDCSCKNEEL